MLLDGAQLDKRNFFFVFLPFLPIIGAATTLTVGFESEFEFELELELELICSSVNPNLS